jgi:hypothetical protein
LFGHQVSIGQLFTQWWEPSIQIGGPNPILTWMWPSKPALLAVLKFPNLSHHTWGVSGSLWVKQSQLGKRYRALLNNFREEFEHCIQE